jgi:hypothetical protein
MLFLRIRGNCVKNSGSGLSHQYPSMRSNCNAISAETLSHEPGRTGVLGRHPNGAMIKSHRETHLHRNGSRKVQPLCTCAILRLRLLDRTSSQCVHYGTLTSIHRTCSWVQLLVFGLPWLAGPPHRLGIQRPCDANRMTHAFSGHI